MWFRISISFCSWTNRENCLGLNVFSTKNGSNATDSFHFDWFEIWTKCITPKNELFRKGQRDISWMNESKTTFSIKSILFPERHRRRWVEKSRSANSENRCEWSMWKRSSEKTLKTLNISQHVRILLKFFLIRFQGVYCMCCSMYRCRHALEMSQQISRKRIEGKNICRSHADTVYVLASWHSSFNKFHIISIIIICVVRTASAVFSAESEDNDDDAVGGWKNYAQSATTLSSLSCRKQGKQANNNNEDDFKQPLSLYPTQHLRNVYCQSHSFISCRQHDATAIHNIFILDLLHALSIRIVFHIQSDSGTTPQAFVLILIYVEFAIDCIENIFKENGATWWNKWNDSSDNTDIAQYQIIFIGIIVAVAIAVIILYFCSCHSRCIYKFLWNNQQRIIDINGQSFDVSVLSCNSFSATTKIMKVAGTRRVWPYSINILYKQQTHTIFFSLTYTIRISWNRTMHLRPIIFTHLIHVLCGSLMWHLWLVQSKENSRKKIIIQFLPFIYHCGLWIGMESTKYTVHLCMLKVETEIHFSIMFVLVLEWECLCVSQNSEEKNIPPNWTSKMRLPCPAVSVRETEVSRKCLEVSKNKSSEDWRVRKKALHSPQPRTIVNDSTVVFVSNFLLLFRSEIGRFMENCGGMWQTHDFQQKQHQKIDAEPSLIFTVRHEETEATMTHRWPLIMTNDESNQSPMTLEILKQGKECVNY